MGYASSISSWGNSAAIRLPKSLLGAAGLRLGDKVNISTNAAGNIEIAPAQKEHRHVRPEPGITYETLFAHYAPANLPTDQWPNDDLIGAEYEAWS
ncbi:AbrB/MazE/SpoVT family DNA-binding domain-containing protein [Adlercreutzia murintestinalis]|jgi:Growth regulator|uniref:AbrB/MazE/SpoVT family DNA-binding domain-containing protein n=1 Tax=Adlercreutzia murintestinalis TaxID=2941325 RepID=UPI003D80F7BF